MDRAQGQLRHLAGRALVAGLCVAAAAALIALLSGSMDDTSWRIVGTSLGFSVFSSTAAAGAALRLRAVRWAAAVGTATLAVSAAAFVLLVAELWIDDDGDVLLRGWGIAALLALWGSHAALVLRPLRATDTPAIRRLSVASIVALGIDTAIGVVALLDLFGEELGDPVQRVLAATIIVTLLTTALVPILRRTAPAAAVAPAQRSVDLPGELTTIAAGLDALPPSPELRAAAARLRELATLHHR